VIDMRAHKGQHPRMGAVDVVPFIPVKNMSMKEAIELSRQVAQSAAQKFKLPIFLYEESATAVHRRNLADIRKGPVRGHAGETQAGRVETRFWTDRNASVRRSNRRRRAHGFGGLQREPRDLQPGTSPATSPGRCGI